MSEFGEILETALKKGKDDITRYVWKSAPDKNGKAETVKLVDCSREDLIKFYSHCHSMLYNESDKNPGRYVVIKNIKDQILRCRAELLLRWMKDGKGKRNYTNSSIIDMLLQVAERNKDVLTHETKKTYPVGNFINLAEKPEFYNVPYDYLMSACLGTLKLCDISKLSMRFLTDCGLHFTRQEFNKDLMEIDPETGKPKNRIQVVYEKLNLDPETIRLYPNASGLSFKEFSTALELTSKAYNEYTTDQLKLLSTKLLYRFIQFVERQAYGWEDKMNEIQKVADSKNWSLF